MDAPSLTDVLDSAARLQEVVPDAVLVGGSVAAWYAHHRASFVHDHVLADRAGIDHAARVLADMDAYYADQRGEGDGVASQVARQLAEPRPADARTTWELARYQRLDPRWHDWKAVVGVCAAVSEAMVAPS